MCSIMKNGHMVAVVRASPKSVWVAECESANFLPLSFTTAQGEAQWNPHVPLHHAQQLAIPALNQAS